MKQFGYEGFEVLAMAPLDCYSERVSEEFEFVSLRRVVRRSRNPLKELPALVEIVWGYAKTSADLFFQFTPKMNIYGSIAAFVTRKRCVSTVSGLGYAFTGQRLLGSVLKFLYKLAFSTNYRVIFQNRDDQKFFMMEGVVSPNRTVVVPGSGVNIEHFPCGRQKEGKGTVFLLVSRMLWDKGIREFVEAAKLLKGRFRNAEFWLLGPVDQGNPAAIPIATVEDWKQKGLIEWFGEVDDVFPFLCKATIAVLPSYREGIPRSLLEAMLVARPIVTTNAIGCKETVEEGINGFLVPPTEVEALAKAMTKFMLLSVRIRKIMGKRSRRKAEREFDERIVAGRYLAIAQKLKADLANSSPATG